MVSLVTQPGRPFAIFLCHQASKFVSRCQARCQALSHRASSVGCSSSEDDSSDSLEDVSSLGLGWHHFCRAGGVSDWRVPWTLITIRGCLAITQDFSIAPINLCILIIMGSILLRVGGLGSAAGFLVIFSGPGLGGT